jgi:DNA-binding LacI/PurR family transcriptional regulator
VHQHLSFEPSGAARSIPSTRVPPGVPKMRDVALLAGVSPQTVSRVLNSPELVSNETRSRVLRVIDEVGYRRNFAARALSSSRSRTIGVVDSGSTILGQARMLETVEEAARTAGYATSVAIVHRPSPAAIQQAFQNLIEMDVEGIVVMGNTAALVEAAALAASRVPLAMIASSQLTAPQVIQVAPAGSASARAATRHLLDQGCARIAHIAGPDGWVDAQAREEGWRTELESHGLPADAVFRGDWLPGSGYQAGLDIVEQGSIDGVFAANDHMALGHWPPSPAPASTCRTTSRSSATTTCWAPSTSSPRSRPCGRSSPSWASAASPSSSARSPGSPRRTWRSPLSS